jgi:hypothetical protein
MSKNIIFILMYHRHRLLDLIYYKCSVFHKGCWSLFLFRSTTTHFFNLCNSLLYWILNVSTCILCITTVWWWNQKVQPCYDQRKFIIRLDPQSSSQLIFLEIILPPRQSFKCLFQQKAVLILVDSFHTACHHFKFLDTVNSVIEF